MEPLKINASAGFKKIGDTCLMEPALDALGWKTRRTILFQCYKPHHAIFENHPFVVPVEDAHPSPDYDLSCVTAFMYACPRKVPLAAGYYDQLGMEWQGARLHYRSWMAGKNTSFEGHSLVFPYGYSCASRIDGTITTNGRRPTIQPPFAWWHQIVPRLPQPVTVITGNQPGWDDAVEWPGATLIRGLSIRQTLLAIRAAHVVVSVNTGLLLLANNQGTSIVYLSSVEPWQMFAPGPPVALVKAAYADEFNPDHVIEAVRNIT